MPVRFLVQRGLLALAVLALPAAPAAAQQVTLGLGAAGGVPQDEFRDGVARVGYGLTGLLLVGQGPVAAGVEAGFVTYSRTAAPLPSQLGERSALLGDVVQASRIGHLHGVVRLQLPDGPVRPYVDGLVGVQRFTTATRFREEVVVVGDALVGGNVAERTRTTTTLDADDVAPSYGAGAGVQVRLARGVDGGTPFEAFLDLGARYLFGEPARYRPVEVATPGPEAAVALRESRTDVLRPQVSLVVRLR